MDRFDRIFDLHKLLSASRHPVSRQRIEQELECSRATAKRIIESMRLYLNAPIKYDRQFNGYYYDRSEGDMFELPGIWFNSSELHALLAVQELLGRVQPGLLEKQLAPLRNRIDSLLKLQPGEGDLSQRIRILQAAARPAGPCFEAVCGALAQQHTLNIKYYRRSDDSFSERIISPQRITYYRDNWYLDAYCHQRSALRTFAFDAILSAKHSDQSYISVDHEEMNRHFGSAYGIFAGAGEQHAVLKFSSHRAKWVAQEQWHPEQSGDWLNDGSYQLTLPFSQPHELVMDILKYGADVEVIAPPELRQLVAGQLTQAAALYTD